MTRFECVNTDCNKDLELGTHTMKVVGGEVVCPEAICCDTYMKEIKVKGGGFGGIIKKPGGTIGGKFNSNRYS
tara:strand:- start:2564 stop:2782 length:219 start_codon:yes stop_codon:yes gene_type:complete